VQAILRLRPLALGLVAGTLLLAAGPAGASAATKSKSVSIAGQAVIASVKAKCPSGQRATGGGFRTTPPNIASGKGPILLVYESRKIGQRSWRVSAQNIDTMAPFEPVTLTAFAYCSANASKTKASATSFTTTANVVQLTPIDASCGSGKAQAGGFLLPAPVITANTVNSLLTDAYRLDKDTWRTRALTTKGITLKSFAYCSKTKAPGARTGSVASAMNAVPATAVSAECTRGKSVRAGGFSQPNAVFPPAGGVLDAATGTLPGANYGLFIIPYESLRSGKRWRASAIHAQMGTTSTTLNAIAYCK
jgi:hypothetical protein